MIARNIEIIFGWMSNRSKSNDFCVFLPFKPLFNQSTLTNRLKVTEQVFLKEQQNLF